MTESDSDDKEVPARKIKQKTIQSPKNTDAEKIVMKDDKECELECDKNETKNETKKVVETAEKDISLKGTVHKQIGMLNMRLRKEHTFCTSEG